MSPAAPPPHPPSFYIFKTPNGVRVPAAHFYADIRCGNPRQEPSSKSRHCSCSPFLGGHPLQESRAGRTFQQTPPLFQPPVLLRASVATWRMINCALAVAGHRASKSSCRGQCRDNSRGRDAMTYAIDRHGFGIRMRREVASRRLLASCFLVQLHQDGHSGYAGLSFNCF